MEYSSNENECKRVFRRLSRSKREIIVSWNQEIVIEVWEGLVDILAVTYEGKKRCKGKSFIIQVNS